MSEIPQWALERARALRDEQMFPGNMCPMDNAFALYIAAHETPPVDPIMVKARLLVAETQHNWPDSPWHLNQVARLIAGDEDKSLVVMAAYEGLRRGIELGREQSK